MEELDLCASFWRNMMRLNTLKYTYGENSTTEYH